MWRSISGVVFGYVATAIFVMTASLVLPVALGMDRMFEPGSYAPSRVWILASLVLSFAGAAIGGVVCARVSQNPKAPPVLASFFLVLGLVFFVFGIVSPKDVPIERPAAATLLDATKNVRMPVAVELLNPFLSLGGVLLGARVARPRE